MSTAELPEPAPAPKRQRLAILPTTRLGRWALGLAGASVVLVLAWYPLRPVGSPLGFACGLAGGGVASIAITRRGERAVTAFAALAPLVFVVVFVLAELLIGHD